jgi:hypothetical protein
MAGGHFILNDQSSFGTWVYFGNQTEPVVLRRTECYLVGHGVITLGCDRDADSAPAGFRAPPGRRAPRHQAGQPADRGRRPRQAHRLRRRPHLGRGHAHAGQHDRHAEVHGARAGAGPEGRHARRPVLGRRGGLPAAGPACARSRATTTSPSSTRSSGRPLRSRRRCSRRCRRAPTTSCCGPWPRTATIATRRPVSSRPPCRRHSAPPFQASPRSRAAACPASRRPSRRAPQPAAPAPPRHPSCRCPRLPGTGINQELELEYWRAVRDSAEPKELEGFLARFPQGIYADLARRRLQRLAAPADPDQTVLQGMTRPPGGATLRALPTGGRSL